MSTAVRYTPQKKQELRSRHQLADRLTEFGWVPVVPEDLGEDFIVHIYHEGRATGVNFFVQLKSVTNLRDRRKGDTLPYLFEVKDLLHWEKFTLPVVLIIWDVKLREGRWVLLHDSIQHLDQMQKKWRHQKNKTIQIPWRNTTDDEGLIRLRQGIGRLLFPQISNNQPLEMQLSLSFPPNDEGIRARKAFEKHLKEGNAVTLQGRVIQEIMFSDWFAIWFSEYDQDKIQITLGQTKSSETINYDLFMDNDQEYKASLHNIEFKVEKSGKDLAQISNMHKKNTVLGIRMIFQNQDEKAQGKLTFIGQENEANVKVIHESMQFLHAVSAGGKLRLVGKIEDAVFEQSIDIPKSSGRIFDPEFLQIIDKLCFIQDKTGKALNVSTSGLSAKDFDATNELYTILNRGMIEKKQQTVTGRFPIEAIKIMFELQKKSQPIDIRMQGDESYVELLNIKFSTGKMVRHILDAKIDNKFFNLQKENFHSEEEKYLELKLIDATVVEIFPDKFIRESERLGRVLVERFNANSVFLFGSLVWGKIHNPQTDIDLAVSGLNSGEMYKAIGYLEQITQFPFNLVDINTVPESLRERILTEGKLLYERELVAVG